MKKRDINKKVRVRKRFRKRFSRSKKRYMNIGKETKSKKDTPEGAEQKRHKEEES